MLLATARKLQVMFSLGYVSEVTISESELGYIISAVVDGDSTVQISDSKNYVKHFRSADSAISALKSIGITSARINLNAYQDKSI